ncbi:MULTISPECIES: ABC transporter permease [Oceanibaculum]|jgi:putative spermidine/putrescine transport system permease protein|uniref:Putative spermidine/putrescine transport system permease protein n=1 Tax=Oceanibaculum indicum TaxID=526216 RepID=A0A420WHQ4_9PROT|nr:MULTISPECIES: ABC transporter permease [Oceanibaculum]MCH2393933.1 ABC transporter permease [Oceanibaculum sp.]RKQ70496.1 putative spermidine/putrescine transport system permease protein [Oceanibaculum indicum]
MLTSQRNTYWLLIAPAVLLMLIFYIYPLFQVLWISVTEPYPGLQNYEALLTRPLLHRIWLTTLRICAITTIITVVLGYLVAYAMVHVKETQRAWMMFCILLTFWLSVLIRAFAWVMLLRNEGLVNQGLMALGLISEPLPLVRNEFGVIVGMVHFMLPLAVLPIFSNMTGIDARYVSAARGLGASPWVAFRHIYLPLSKPGLIAATILVFVFSLGFFITPAILGGGKVVMISEYIRVSFEETLRWGQATMLASTLLFAVLLTLALVARFVDLKKVFGAR